MRYTIDANRGLYAAADTAEEAVRTLRDHLECLLGEPDIDYLIVAPDGQFTSGTVVHWKRHPARTLDQLAAELTTDLTTTPARRR